MNGIDGTGVEVGRREAFVGIVGIGAIGAFWYINEDDDLPDFQVSNRSGETQSIVVQTFESKSSDAIIDDSFELDDGDWRDYTVDGQGPYEIVITTPKQGKKTFELDEKYLEDDGMWLEVSVFSDRIEGGTLGV